MESLLKANFNPNGHTEAGLVVIEHTPRCSYSGSLVGLRPCGTKDSLHSSLSTADDRRHTYGRKHLTRSVEINLWLIAAHLFAVVLDMLSSPPDPSASMLVKLCLSSHASVSAGQPGA